jgi:uncharacterized protein YbjT (DUF2867 family)
MSESKTTYLVMGAAGDLGHRILKALMGTKEGKRVRAGVRGGSTGKHASLARNWSAAGVTVLDAELHNAESLKRACDGVDTVISAVQGGPETIIDGQAKLLDASVKAGISRFVPSDFSEDLFSIPEGINPYLDWRRTFDLRVEPSGIGYMHFLNGGFMDAVFSSPGLIDTQAGTITYWGDGEIPLDFTSMDDVAAYLAAAASNPYALNTVVEIAGDRRTIAEIASDFEAVTGQSLKPVRRGSIEEGYAELKRMEAAGANAMAMLPLQYLLPMMSGEGQLRRLANDRYPAVRRTPLRDFMRKQYGNKRVQGAARPTALR